MSLLNVHVARERAFVVTDTEAYFPHNGSKAAASKMFPLAHAGAVIAVTGVNSVALGLMNELQALSTFDEIWPALINDRVVDGVVRSMEEFHRGAGIPVLPLQRIVLVGYSHASEQCLGLLVHREQAGEAFKLGQIATSILGPVEPSMDLPYGPGTAGGEPDSAEKLLEVARHQVRVMKELHPHFPGTELPMAIGGRFNVAEIVKDRVTISIVG